MAGQPKKFKNGQELIDLFRTFCEEIADNGFCKVPNQTNFCRWLADNFDDVDRKTIYNSLNKYFPTIKSEFEQIQGDIIAEGGMLGKYQPTMSIFALKNWCRWADKQEITTSSIDETTRAEVNELVEEYRKQQSDDE